MKTLVEYIVIPMAVAIQCTEWRAVQPTYITINVHLAPRNCGQELTKKEQSNRHTKTGEYRWHKSVFLWPQPSLQNIRCEIELQI